MGSTYSKLILHLVFSTKHRERLMRPEFEPRLHSFIGGIVRDEGGVLLTSGGMSDHAHLLVGWRPDATVSDLLRNIKARSSRWANQEFGGRRFAWQEGFGVFSVSQSQCSAVRRYIDSQPEHHRERSFEEEFLAILRAHGVEFDPRYVLD